MITIVVANRSLAFPLVLGIFFGGLFALDAATSFSFLMCTPGECVQWNGFSSSRVIAEWSPQGRALVRTHAGQFDVRSDERAWAARVDAYVANPHGKLELLHTNFSPMFWWVVFTCWAIGAARRAGTTFTVDSGRGTVEIEKRGFSIRRRTLQVDRMRSAAFEERPDGEGRYWYELVVVYKDGTRERIHDRQDSAGERLVSAISSAIAAQTPAHTASA